MLAIFLELNSKRLYQSSRKKRLCLVFTSPTKRVHTNLDPLEPHTWYLRQHGFGVMYRVRIQLSTRIRTLLRFTFANYWPVQLPVSMLKWNPPLLFRGICKCCCGYIEHTWAQWAGLPISCLYHAPLRALDEPKVVLEDPEEESF